MKIMFPFTRNRSVRAVAIVLCAGFLGGYSLLAGDAKIVTPPVEEEPVFTNWIDLSLGGLILHGTRQEFQQQHPITGPVFGGISDMHFEKTLLNKALLTIDGHALFDNNDYKVKIDLSLPDVGYIRAGFTEFTTYFNGNGGYLPPNSGEPGYTRGVQNSLPAGGIPNGQFFTGPEFALTRTLLWAEIGLRMPNLPELTLRYEHATRKGQEDSTEWGSTAFTGYAATTNNSASRKMVPAFRNIDETRDTFTLDGKYTIGKPDAFGSTDINLGMTYERTNTDDSLNTRNNPGAYPTVQAANNYLGIPIAATDYFTTQTDTQQMNLYSGQLSTVTHFGEKLWLTLGFSYTAMNTNIGGNRVAGPEYGNPYAPVIDNKIYAGVNSAYLDLGGGSNVGQSVAAVNLLWMPIPGLSITPSFRIENTKTNSESSFIQEVGQTNGTMSITLPNKKKVNAAWIKSPAGHIGNPTTVNSQVQVTELAESLDIRYTGFDNWVLYAQADWAQNFEDRSDTTHQGSYTFNSYNATTGKDTGIPSNRLAFSAFNTWVNQKYSIGANWYPLHQMNMAFQYYYSIQDFSQNINQDDPVRVNQRLLSQNWKTSDVNFRVTWKPVGCLSLVTRYDFQSTAVYSEWEKDPIRSGFIAPPTLSSRMTNNMLTECVTWTPLDRLYIQANLAYVLNVTSSPCTSQSPGVQNSNNDYWTASIGAGFAIDNKTQLRADCSYYRANNYQYTQYTMPYGAGNTEVDFSASISRQITRNVAVSLKYYCSSYTDQTSGGNNNYLAQTIMSGMQVRF
ncbi:MAG: hypothetical protein WCQ16_05470 [Verrucomicrobiae bacterium]